jgi:hypothetical protein
VETLEAALAAIAALTARVERLEQERQPASDPRHGERLRVLWESTEGDDFTSVALLEYAATAAKPALKAMLEGALIDLTEPGARKSCGRLLRRLEKAGAVGGLCLSRLADSREGIVWAVRVSQVSPPKNARA